MKWKILLTLSLIAFGAFIVYIVQESHLTTKETVVIFGEDSSNLKAYSSLNDKFTAKTGIQMKFEGATFEQSIQKADADFRNGTGEYDIVLQYNFSLAAYVRNKYVADIGDAFSPSVLSNLRVVNEGMFQNALRETSFYYSNPEDTNSPAKQFGLPFAANTMLLVYNKNLFENADLRQNFKEVTGNELAPPTDWNDYLVVAEFFAKTQPDLKGVAMQGAADGWLYYELANYLFGMGTGTSTMGGEQSPHHCHPEKRGGFTIRQKASRLLLRRFLYRRSLATTGNHA